MNVALVARWEGFLAKVAERLEALIAEAGPGVLGIAEAHPDDPLPVGNALSGLDHRFSQLKDRIEQTWDQQVGELFSSSGDDALHDRGLDLKQDAELALDHRWAQAKAGWLATIALSAEARAEDEAGRSVPCPRCAAPLDPPDRRRTVAMACPACGSVCQVAATPAARAWWGAGIGALAEQAALPLRFEVERFRIEVDRWRRARGWAPETLEQLERWRALEYACWRRLVDERARLSGEPPDEALLASRMAFFDRTNLHTNQVWVRAHGRT